MRNPTEMPRNPSLARYSGIAASIFVIGAATAAQEKTGEERELQRFHNAVKTGDTETVGSLLRNHPTLVNRRGTSPGGVARSTPLHVAAETLQVEVARTLLQQKASVDAQDAHGETPLVRAINRLTATPAQRSFVELLLAHGADTEATGRIARLTPLIMATIRGNHGIVRPLLAKGAKIVPTGFDGTAVHIAAALGHTETLQLLLDHGASQDLETRGGVRPIHLAALHGQLLITKLLLQRKAKVTARLANGSTSLHLASLRTPPATSTKTAIEGARASAPVLPPQVLSLVGQHFEEHLRKVGNRHRDVIVELVKAGAVVDARDRIGQSALHIAASAGNLPGVEALLAAGAEFDAVTRFGHTPLLRAAMLGHSEVARRLLDSGANIHAVDREGFTALHSAAERGHTKAIGILLAKGARVDAQTTDKRTALYCAAQQGHFDTVRALLAAKPEIDLPEHNGATPLSVAALNSRTAVVELLAAGGARLDHLDKTGTTPLWHAVFRGHEKVVATLMKHGADPNAGSVGGNAPLHVAAARKRSTIVGMLLDRSDDDPEAARADPNRPNDSGWTPLHWAAHSGSPDIVSMLLRVGAEPQRKNRQGKTAADITRSEAVRKVLEDHGRK